MAEPTVTALQALAGPDADAAWGSLVEAHGRDVWRMILSRSRDAHEAEDAYQDYWLRLPQRAVNFRAQGTEAERSARAWLLRVAYTQAIDQLRRRRAQPLVLDVAHAAAEEPTMDDPAEQSHLMERVHAALEELPESYRRPLVLHVVGGLSYDELAEDLRCTVNHARVKVHRGLKRLRELLGVEGRGLSDQTLSGLMLPPLLLAPPALAATPAAAASAAAKGVLGKTAASAAAKSSVTAQFAAAAGAAGKTGALVALAKAPLVLGAAVLVTTTSVVAVTHPGETMSVFRSIAAVVTGTTALSAATVLDDFNRSTLEMIGSGDSQVHAELSLVPAPPGSNGGSGQALHIGWPAPHGRWVDCAYNPLRPTLSITGEQDQVLTVNVWSEAFAGLKRLAVRFSDAHGEVFQWRAEIPFPERTGWRVVTIPLTWHKLEKSWGQNTDGVVDFPIRLAGYAVDFERLEVPASSIVLDDVTLGAQQ